MNERPSYVMLTPVDDTGRPTGQCWRRREDAPEQLVRCSIGTRLLFRDHRGNTRSVTVKEAPAIVLERYGAAFAQAKDSTPDPSA